MTPLRLSHDAATVLGLAGTALPFAQSVDEEVERWLRPLRLYGEAGASLQALGVDEDQHDVAQHVPPKAAEDTPQETLRIVTAAASRLAEERGASAVGTVDILTAVMYHYGDAFERALDRHSGDSAELARHLTVGN